MTILKKTVTGFVLGAGILLLILFSVPALVFADEQDVPHDDNVMSEQVLTEGEHFIGDGHIDHTHAIVSTTLWWKSTVWWGLFLVSLLLISLLSFGVYKYLQDKPIKKKPFPNSEDNTK